MKVTSENEMREISRKAKKILGMLKRGVKFSPTQCDIVKIKNRLYIILIQFDEIQTNARKI